MLKSIVRSLYSLLTLPDDLDLPPAASSAPAGVPVPAAVACSLASGTDRLTAGAVSIVGLRQVRHAIGTDWPQVEADIMAVTRRVLEQMIAPPDHFTQYDGETVLICYADPDKDAAQRHTESVANVLQVALENEIPSLVRQIATDHVVGDVPVTEVMLRGDAATEALKGLRQIQEEERVAARAEAAAWMRGARLLFQPVWEPRSLRTGANRCVLEFSTQSASLAQLEDSLDAGAVGDATARLDFAVFAKAVEALHGANDRRQGALIIPLHFQTMTQPRWRSDYIKMCSAVPERYKRLIQLELQAVPPETTAEEFASVTRMLGEATRTLLWNLSLAVPQPRVLQSARLAGLTLDFSELVGLRDMREPVRGLVRYARNHGLEPHAVGVNTIGQAQAARDADFASIGGTAIHAMIDEPRTVTRFSPLPHKSSVRWSSHLSTA